MKNLPPAIRAAVITSVQTFVGTALVTLLGILGAVQDWVGGGDPPDLTAPAKVVASAAVAVVVGVVTALYRTVKPPAESYPDAELHQ